jgi:hypothetical protein
MARLMHEGGPTMFWILMLVLPGLALVILHAVLAHRWSLWTSLGVMALVLAIGLYGCSKGRSMTDDAIASFENVTLRDREEMRAQGYKESSRPIELALIVDGIFAVPVVIGQVRRRRRRL